jgi:hypothetical protein
MYICMCVWTLFLFLDSFLVYVSVHMHIQWTKYVYICMCVWTPCRAYSEYSIHMCLYVCMYYTLKVLVCVSPCPIDPKGV